MKMSREVCHESLQHESLSIADGWVRLFANRARPYAQQQPDGSYRWVYEDCTPHLAAAHLAGEVTLAFSSTDARGYARWACLDVDVPASLPQVLLLRAALAELGLPGLVEASRRGGHLWLLLDEAIPAVALRFAVAGALSEAAAMGVEIPTYELYPDTSVVGALGHAVRLPLGVHRKTGRRYPLFDDEGLPCTFTATENAAAFVLGVTRARAAPLRERWQALVATRKAARAKQTQQAEQVSAVGVRESPESTRGARVGPQVGTRSVVIRWVDACISPLDLLAELAPDAEMRRAGRGSIGWCPFHDDRAPDAATGAAGSASFYVVDDRRYGWSWRCLSTNCAQSAGPMRHTFRLLQELLGVSVAAAIREAASRWPAAAAEAERMDTVGQPWREDAAESEEIADGA
jgi:TOTE conflict system, Archaeo-Eukaryotic Primase domain